MKINEMPYLCALLYEMLVESFDPSDQIESDLSTRSNSKLVPTNETRPDAVSLDLHCTSYALVSHPTVK